MSKMTAEEIRLTKDAIGLFETDNNTFARNLMKLGRMTHEEARQFFIKALNSRVIQEDRGRVRMTPPPPDPRAISDAKIQELKEAGYNVYIVYDGSPSVYAWKHRAGASQSDFRNVQPFRLTPAQAWVDCYKYASGALPEIPERDWMS